MQVILFETLHSIGLSLLVFLILPSFDAIKGSMVTNSVCLLPGILLLLKNRSKGSNKSNHSEQNQRDSIDSLKQKTEKNIEIIGIVAIVCQIIALIIWPIITYYDHIHQFWSLPIALILISMCWWENFLNRSSRNTIVQKLMAAKKDLAESRY